MHGRDLTRKATDLEVGMGGAPAAVVLQQQTQAVQALTGALAVAIRHLQQATHQAPSPLEGSLEAGLLACMQTAHPHTLCAFLTLTTLLQNATANWPPTLLVQKHDWLHTHTGSNTQAREELL